MPDTAISFSKEKEPNPYGVSSGSLLTRPKDAAFRPERIMLENRAFKLDPGEACWCNLGKSCEGNHEIFIGEPVNVCGFCGEEFELSNTDPHFASGRGPTCPNPRQAASRS